MWLCLIGVTSPLTNQFTGGGAYTPEQQSTLQLQGDFAAASM